MRFIKTETGKYVAVGHHRPVEICITKDHQGFWQYNDGFSQTPSYLCGKLYEAKFAVEQMCGSDQCVG